MTGCIKQSDRDGKMRETLAIICLVISFISLLLYNILVYGVGAVEYKDVNINSFDRFNDGAKMEGDTIVLFENDEAPSTVAVQLVVPRDAKRMRFQIVTDSTDTNEIEVRVQDELIMNADRIGLSEGLHQYVGSMEISELTKNDAYLVISGEVKGNVRIKEMAIGFSSGLHAGKLRYALLFSTFFFGLFFLIIEGKIELTTKIFKGHEG